MDLRKGVVMKRTAFGAALLLFVLAACAPPGGGGDGGGGDGGGNNPPPGGGGYPDNPPQQNYILTAWNDLGMHCMDSDYSVFSILPPYNNLHAQLKRKDGSLVTSGIELTYESTTGVDGGINTYSHGKTNFWDHAASFFGATLAPDVGLKGNPAPSTQPAALALNPDQGWWEAEGIPLTPYNDDGSKNFYPLVKVVARDASGQVLASANVVLPVSDEMDCRLCHGSNASRDDAKPRGGWVDDPNPEKDYRLNVLRLHDEKQPDAVRDRLSRLQGLGYAYDPAGLEATARGGTPMLCAACHKSNALPGVGLGIKPFTSAIHHPQEARQRDRPAQRDEAERREQPRHLLRPPPGRGDRLPARRHGRRQKPRRQPEDAVPELPRPHESRRRRRTRRLVRRAQLPGLPLRRAS